MLDLRNKGSDVKAEVGDGVDTTVKVLKLVLCVVLW